MGNIFAGSEIVELGIQIEKNGRDFYAVLAKQYQDTESAKTFEYLAAEEEKHIAVFQGILDAAEEYEPPQSYPGEYIAYMKALAQDCVFTQAGAGAAAAKNATSERRAIELGIDFEKDSIVFYQGMERLVPQYDHGVLDALISQEQLHLQRLMEMKSALP